MIIIILITSTYLCICFEQRTCFYLAQFVDQRLSLVVICDIKKTFAMSNSSLCYHRCSSYYLLFLKQYFYISNRPQTTMTCAAVRPASISAYSLLWPVPATKAKYLVYGTTPPSANVPKTRNSCQVSMYYSRCIVQLGKQQLVIALEQFFLRNKHNVSSNNEHVVCCNNNKIIIITTSMGVDYNI